MSALLHSTSLVITSELTSIGFEAALVGIPVIFLSQALPPVDLMPTGVPGDLWSIARDEVDLIEKYESYLALRMNHGSLGESALMARAKLLTRVSQARVRDFVS